MEDRTVILAAGDFPKKGGTAWKLLATATRVVACDSAADAYRRRRPNCLILISGGTKAHSIATITTVKIEIPTPNARVRTSTPIARRKRKHIRSVIFVVIIYSKSISSIR